MELSENAKPSSSQKGSPIHYSALERWVLRRTHPVAIILDLVGSIWAIYFLWERYWDYALGVLVIERMFSMVLVWRVDFQAIGPTLIGRIALMHLHPVNLALQVLGLAIGCYGVWEHSVDFTLAGISLVLIGHFFGWQKIHNSLQLTEKGT